MEYFKVTIILKLPYKPENYPEGITKTKACELEEQALNDGDIAIDDYLEICEDFEVIVEP